MKQLPAARYPFFCIAALRQNPLTLRDRTMCDCLLPSSLSQLGATNGLATTKMRTNTGCLKQVRMHCISANMLNKAGTLHQDTCTFLLAKGNTIQRIFKSPNQRAPDLGHLAMCRSSPIHSESYISDSISEARAASAITQSQCGCIVAVRNLGQTYPQSGAQGQKISRFP